MTLPDADAAARKPSLRARAFKLLLRMLRRKRIYASVEGLIEGIEQTRRAGPARPRKSLLRNADVRREVVAGCEVYTLAPRHAVGEEHVLYLHGGGYVRPITPFHWDFLEWLVLTRRSTVVVPLYPLAPENTCNRTLQAVREIHEVALRRNGNFAAFMGDSAGAGLCLALCQELGNAALDRPRRLVLITPFVDVTIKNPAIVDTDARDLMLGPVGVREAGRLYAGDLPMDHPHVSPVNADLRGLPPMQIFVATDDILGHDALIFADHARKGGTEVELHVGQGLMHVWPLLPIPEARMARDAMGRFLQQGHERRPASMSRRAEA